MNKNFAHVALSLTQEKPLVYTAMSKHIFYYRLFISKFVLEQGCVPINPFTAFDYFMLDTVDRDLVRAANNNLVMRCDELWVFGQISNGVFAEMKLARLLNKKMRFFNIGHSSNIIECQMCDCGMESEMMAFKHEIKQLNNSGIE